MPPDGDERRKTICPAHDELLRLNKATFREIMSGRKVLNRLDVTVHGIPEDGVLGLVQKVNCLTEYKPTLHFIKTVHYIGGRILIIVCAAGILGAFSWLLWMARTHGG